MDYYSKYVKYKNKYLKLQGGESELDSYIKAGNIHKEIKKEIMPMIVPGTRIYDIFKKIRDLTLSYGGSIAFPPCISVGNMIAHNCPFSTDNTIIDYNHMVKIDYGVSVNGWIVDSAFSVNFDPKLDNLRTATLEAMNAGIKEIGIDVPINNIGRAINEIIDSYEFKIIADLTGHSIERYNLHGDIRIPNIRNNNITRLKKGAYAIEPLVSLKTDSIIYGNNTNSFKYKNINFCQEDSLFFPGSHQEQNIISPYIDDIIAHFEHTIYIDEDKKILLT